MREKHPINSKKIFTIIFLLLGLFLFLVYYRKIYQKKTNQWMPASIGDSQQNLSVAPPTPMLAKKMNVLNMKGWIQYTSKFKHEEGVHRETGDYAYTFLYPKDWTAKNNLTSNGCSVTELTSPNSTKLVLTDICESWGDEYSLLPTNSVLIKTVENVGQDGYTDNTMRALKTTNNYWYGESATENGAIPFTNKDEIADAFTLHSKWYDKFMKGEVYITISNSEIKQNDLDISDNIINSLKLIKK